MITYMFVVEWMGGEEDSMTADAVCLRDAWDIVQADARGQGEVRSIAFINTSEDLG